MLDIFRVIYVIRLSLLVPKQSLFDKNVHLIFDHFEQSRRFVEILSQPFDNLDFFFFIGGYLIRFAKDLIVWFREFE